MRLNVSSIAFAPLFGAFLLSSAAAYAQEGDSEPYPEEVAAEQNYEYEAPAQEGEVAANYSESGNSEATFDVASEDASKEEADSNSVVKGHGLQAALTFAAVPDAILDKWFKYHGSTWDGTANMGFSLDYFLRFQRPCEMRFSLSWVNGRTGNAYWLEDKRADSPHLADYVVQNYSILALEVAAYHVVRIIDEVAFYYGGGGWFGAILGDAKGYAIRATCANSGGDITSCPHEPGSVPFSYMPKVMGFVVATVGFKFTLFDTMTIRAEGGFKGYFYGQLGLGAEF